jgi:hypothetical protein
VTEYRAEMVVCLFFILVGLAVAIFLLKGDMDHLSGCGDYHTLAAVRHCLRTTP